MLNGFCDRNVRMTLDARVQVMVRYDNINSTDIGKSRIALTDIMVTKLTLAQE